MQVNASVPTSSLLLCPTVKYRLQVLDLQAVVEKLAADPLTFSSCKILWIMQFSVLVDVIQFLYTFSLNVASKICHSLFCKRNKTCFLISQTVLNCV